MNRIYTHGKRTYNVGVTLLPLTSALKKKKKIDSAIREQI